MAKQRNSLGIVVLPTEVDDLGNGISWEEYFRL